MKNFVLAFGLMFLSLIALGQRKSMGLFAIDVLFPQNAPPSVNTGLGFSFGYERKISSQCTWLVQTGLNSIPVNHSGLFNFKSIGYAFVPIVAGFKYYPIESFNGFYLETDLGMNWIYEDVPYIATQRLERFAFIPAIGYHFKSGEISIRENLIQDYPYLGLRLAGKF